MKQEEPALRAGSLVAEVGPLCWTYPMRGAALLDEVANVLWASLKPAAARIGITVVPPDAVADREPNTIQLVAAAFVHVGDREFWVVKKLLHFQVSSCQYCGHTS